MMVQQKGSQGGSHFGGVSLSSFLQMLEHERKSCTLSVSSGNRQGCFYFDHGVLIDAQAGGEIGQNAAYAILLWENPVFSVMPAEDRMKRIHLPLAHILLDSAKQSDEQVPESVAGSDIGAGAGDSADHPGAAWHPDPAVRRVIQSLSLISGIRHYFLLNRQGKIIVQSARQHNIGDFIAYCIVSGIQMRNVLEVKGPSRIQIRLENGETILIMPGDGMIVGVLLEESASVSEVSNKLLNVILTRQG